MNQLSPRQLQVFLAIARCGNVTHAAQQLHLTQPAASMALAELERQLGVTLFTRQGRRLVLNGEGRTALPLAQECVARWQELSSLFQLPSHGALELRMGASLTIGSYILPALLASFLTQQPQVRPQLRLDNSAAIVHAVAAGELDLGFIEGELQHSEVRLYPWREDRLVLHCAANHPLAGQSLDWSTLLQLPWVLRERGSGTRQIFERACGPYAAQLRVILELSQPEALCQAVQAGLGVGCQSHYILASALATGQLQRLYAPELNLQRWFYVVLRHGHYHSRVLRLWLEHCQLAV